MIIINMTSFIYPSRDTVYASEHMHVVGCVRLGTFVICVLAYAYLCPRVCVCVCVCVCQTVAHWYAECLRFPCGAGWDRKHLSPLQRSSMLPT